MPIKETLLGLIDQIESEEGRLDQLLNPEQCEQCGELEHWAPKEVLAHYAGWTMRQTEIFQKGRNGEQLLKYDDYLELNDQDFLIYREMTWAESLEHSRLARQALRELLSEFSEADLQNPAPFLTPDPRPLWRRFVDTSIEHPLIHISFILNAVGQWEASTRLQETVSEELIRLDPENHEWCGTVKYNLACQYALTGQKSKALSTLKTALTLAPGLVEWSKQDSDLDEIRAEITY